MDGLNGNFDLVRNRAFAEVTRVERLGELQGIQYLDGALERLTQANPQSPEALISALQLLVQQDPQTQDDALPRCNIRSLIKECAERLGITLQS